MNSFHILDLKIGWRKGWMNCCLMSECLHHTMAPRCAQKIFDSIYVTSHIASTLLPLLEGVCENGQEEGKGGDEGLPLGLVGMVWDKNLPG